MEIHVALLTVLATVLVTEFMGSGSQVQINAVRPRPLRLGRPLSFSRTISASIPARRVCYYQSGTIKRPGLASYNISQIPGNLCTHVVYTFCALSEHTWEIVQKNPAFDADEGGYARFVDLKREFPHLRLTASIGGWGENGTKYSQMVRVPQRRSVFVRSVVEFLLTYGFDGLDIDWEYPADPKRGGVPEDKENFPLLLQELRAAFDSEGLGWELTVAATSTRNKVEEGYDVAKICKSVDAVYLMTYNLRGIWNQYADVHSMLYNRPGLDTGNKVELTVDGGARLWEDLGCPSYKIVVGVPFYGKSYTLCRPEQHDLHAPITGVGEPGPILKSSGVLMYYEICSLLNDNDWTKAWDSVGLVPYAYSGNQWVGYEDSESLAVKMDYIRTKGYLGAMVWAINDDDFRGLCGLGTYPMMNVIYNGLKDYYVPRNDE